MTWEELRVLLNSYHADNEDLSGRVTFTSTDSCEFLDLVQSQTKDAFTFIADWNAEPEDG